MTSTITTSPLQDGEGYVTIHSVRRWYRVAGSANGGPPLVVLPEEPGGSLYLFEHTIGPRLEAFATLVYFEPSGGRSGPPYDPGSDSMETLAANLEGLRQALNRTHIVLVGPAFGGALALEYALAHPQMVAGLILTGPASAGAERIARVQLDGLAFVAEGAAKAALAALRQGPGSPVDQLEQAWQMVDEAARQRLEFLNPEAAQHARQVEQAARPTGGPGADKSLPGALLAGSPRHPALLDELPSIKVPVLVLCGLHDRTTGIEISRDTAALLPNGELGVFQASARYPYIEEPHQYAITVREWLQRTVLAVQGLPSYQLQMVWPYARLSDPPRPHLPPGYRLRPYRPGDEPEFYRIMALSGWPEWDDERLEPWLWRIVPGSWFMAVHEASGQLAASAMGLHSAEPRHPFGGELGWVCSDPAHRGQGLGMAVVAATTGRLIEAGYRNVHLYSEDFRLPALKTYLKLGYVPLLYAPDMPVRWQAICAQIGWPFEPEVWMRARD